MPIGFISAATIAGGTAFLDSALTTLFAGAVLSSIAATGARTPVNVVLSRGPLAYYGRISYGLYMTHIMVFVYFGWFDAHMDKFGVPGNLAVVAFRIIACTIAATILWYGFESRILRLKRYFDNKPRKSRPPEQSFSAAAK
jgi:peptidoglycan/LPS O-acetylase OafA/YrhL